MGMWFATMYDLNERKQSMRLRILTVEQLETKALLTSLSFIKHEIVREDSSAVAAADLDGNGHVDLLVQHGETKLSWFANTGGAKAFGPPREFVVELLSEDYSLEELLFPLSSIVTADIDDDGDQDVGFSGGVLGWLENLSGDATDWQLQVIEESSLYSTVFTDLNADGHLDVVGVETFNSESVLLTFTNDGAGNFSANRFEDLFNRTPTQIQFAKISDDKRPDLSVTYFDREAPREWTTWHLASENTFGDEQALNIEMRPFDKFVFADVDNDGDDDVLVQSPNSVGWFINEVGDLVEQDLFCKM